MYKNILLTIDLTEKSSWKKALPTAVDCCRAFGGKLHLMAVVPDYGMTIVSQFFPKGYAEEAIGAATKAVEKLAADEVPDDIRVQCIVTYGTVYEEIIETAKNTSTDLIVIAAQRPELQDYLLGPNAARVVRHANCSVFVVR